MVNINSDPNSQNNIHHTSYLRFKDKFSYVKEFWAGNKNYDRCWVPWAWCDIKKQQIENNSIVIFSPSNDTMHAVKADYNHLNHQRTQLYGNLWFNEIHVETMPNWEKLELPIDFERKMLDLNYGFFNTVEKFIPYRIKKHLKKETVVTSNTHVDRKY